MSATSTVSCPFCAEQIPVGSTMCPHCNEPLTGAAPSVAPAAPVAPTAQGAASRPKSKRTLVIIGGVVAAAAVLIVGAVFGIRAYEENQFNELIKNSKTHLCSQAAAKLSAQHHTKEVLGDCQIHPEKGESAVVRVTLRVKADVMSEDQLRDYGRVVYRLKDTRKGIRCTWAHLGKNWICGN